MSKNYNDWFEFEKEINTSNLTTHKKEVLEKWAKNETLHFILKAIYDPYTKYYVSKKAIQKLTILDDTKVNWEVVKDFDLEKLLFKLSTREITGHEALHTTKYFILNCGYGNLVTKIIDRDSQLRVGTTLINKAIPGLIPKFEVQLAEPYHVKRINLETECWIASRKLDGVRCLAVIDNVGDINFFSRSGKPFETLNKLKEQLEKLNLKGVVLDGEVCMVDEDGNESFNGIMKEIKKKDWTIQNPAFIVFDILSFDDFVKGSTEHIFSQRYTNLSHFFFTYGEVLTNFKMLVHEQVKDNADLEIWKQRSLDNAWEGFMLKKDVPYQGKRSHDMLKYKVMLDVECIIVGWEMGLIRVIIDDQEVEEEMLSAIIVKYGNSTTRVGSGFSLKERREYYLNPEQLRGKETTVQYFEATVNKAGEDSLRFPVKKVIWLEGKRDI